MNIDGSQTMFKAIRNNDRILFEDYNLAKELWDRIKSIVPQEVDNAEAIGLNEMFRFYKYNPGQRFKMHRDGSYKKNELEYSLYTFMIYLNDDFEGGETIFKEGQIITPSTGDLLLFYHPLKHEGKALLSGTKYVLRTDVMYKNLNNN